MRCFHIQTNQRKLVVLQESVSESGGPVTFTVERSQGVEGNIDVRWEVEAAGRMDLTPSSGSLFFQQVSDQHSIRS